MAHALWGYDGPCKNIHGHSYYLYVTIIGEILQDDNSPKNGMVMDFGELKSIVKSEIVDELDHALAIYDKTPKHIVDSLKPTFNLVLTPYQPTCENLINDFAMRLKTKFSPHIKLFGLKLCETVTSFAEWYAEDYPVGK